MAKVAFYIMGLKGYVTLDRFIKKHGVEEIAYVVSSNNHDIMTDYFDEIRDLTLASNIKFFQRTDTFTELEKIPKLYKFAIGWRWMIANELRLIIFHDSLLPKYRGFAPLVNALINKESYLGVTALEASDSYDQGNIISQKKLPIEYPIKVSEAIEKILPLYFCLVDDLYTKINEEIGYEVQKQNEKDASYSPWLNSDDYYIDWSWSATDIKRFVDAVGDPYDGAKALLESKIINIIEVDVVDDVTIENRHRHVGKVIFKIHEFPVVVCQTGLLKLVDIRDDQRNPIAIKFRSKFY